ncbi:hypothetical protein ACSA002_0680 [Salmonella phage vB_SalM_SA002]|nr:hypothetical protein ACSA002_0680 [Salmonella phage vB_SalM_SA002]
MNTATPVASVAKSIFNFKRPDLLTPKSETKEETIVIKLERTPVKVSKPPYTPDRLVALLNRLEHQNQVIKAVQMGGWVLGCRMQDDITGILAKGSEDFDLSHYVWYGRADVWQHAMNLDDLVAELQKRHGTAIKPGYLSEKCLELEFTVRIVMLDR